MTSVFNKLLIALQVKLLADIPDSEGTPGIRLVDQDLSQIDVAPRPAIASGGNVYIDYISTQYVQKQLKTQWAEMNILLRLAFDPYSVSNSLAPTEVREKALVYYEIENKIYIALQDWKGANNGDPDLLMLPMKRISAVTEKREDTLRVRHIIFKATYEDRVLQALQP